MRQISIFKVLYKSLYSPKEIAKYRFLPMGKTMQFVFLLIFVNTLPGLFELFYNKQTFTDIPETASDAGTIWFFTAVKIGMLYVLNTGLIVLTITVLSSIGEPVAKLLKRKLPYRQSWRLTACSLTLPIILFSILHLLGFNSPYYTIAALILNVIILIISIRAIPKPRKIK